MACEITDGDRVSRIEVGRGCATAGALLLPGVTRAGIVAQPSVENRAVEIAGAIKDRGVESEVLVVPDGDSAKNLETVEIAYEWLNALGFTRGDMVIGVGGGAVTDFSGFVAATYLRGVDVTYLPTTLLGAVDASIGGKTGVNVGGKNLAGVFRHPARVVVDLDILEGLPVGLLQEGAAETVKAGFISSAPIIAEYEANGLEASLDVVVPAAIKVKVDTVQADFTERGLRAILNYGHTIGHAVEIVAGISHGEAVSIGMIAAGEISAALLGFKHASRQKAILENIGLPVSIEGIDKAEVLELMGRDKKRDSGGMRMVLLEDFTVPVVRHVGADEIALGLDAIGVVD